VPWIGGTIFQKEIKPESAPPIRKEGGAPRTVDRKHLTACKINRQGWVKMALVATMEGIYGNSVFPVKKPFGVVNTRGKP
jgi:hypothetical protein